MKLQNSKNEVELSEFFLDFAKMIIFTIFVKMFHAKKDCIFTEFYNIIHMKFTLGWKDLRFLTQFKPISKKGGKKNDNF